MDDVKNGLNRQVLTRRNSAETTDTTWGVEKVMLPCTATGFPPASYKSPQEFLRSDRNKPIMSGLLRLTSLNKILKDELKD